MSDADGDQIPGGRVVRAGATVRRPAGYWTPAVHALLQHLAHVDFCAPRVVGVDGDAEILTFVEGATPTKEDVANWIDDAVLASVGRLLRQYHGAVGSFNPPRWARWQQTSIPTTGTLVCHTDLYLGNVVFRDRRAIGLIDFDFAHPADPLWDLAMAAWHWVPLSTNSMSKHIPESEWARRLRVFVDAYGVETRRRKDVLRVIGDLGRRMRNKRAAEGYATSLFDNSLAAQERQWDSLLDALK